MLISSFPALHVELISLDDHLSIVSPKPWVESSTGRRVAAYRLAALVWTPPPGWRAEGPLRKVIVQRTGEAPLLAGVALEWAVWYREAPIYGRLLCLPGERESVHLVESPDATRIPTREEVSRTHDGLLWLAQPSKGGAPRGLRSFHSPEECREALIRAAESLYRKSIVPTVPWLAQLLRFRTSERTIYRWCATYGWDMEGIKAEARARALTEGS
jgi:hypothetical protein